MAKTKQSRAGVLVLAPLLAVAISLSFGPAAVGGSGQPEGDYSPYVDAQGAISLPRDYRASWVHLGSWVVPDDQAPGYGFHDVYAQQSTIRAYKETGQFPDGAVLVKEIREIESGQLTTGQASWAGEIKVWFVMVKDAKNRFPDHPGWGQGWGWALFEAKDPAKNTVTNYRADCLGCHAPVKDSDWVFTDGYPTLSGSSHD